MFGLLTVGMFLVSAVPVLALADDSAVNQEAYSNTQQVLKNPSERQKLLSKDAKAKAADSSVQALTGSPELSEEVYALAADIFEKLFKDTHGDTAKMNEVMSKAMRDPASFAGTLTSDQVKRLKELSSKIESQKTNKSN